MFYRQKFIIKLKVKKLKVVSYLIMKAHSRATERHLPYGITVLPATRHR